MNIVHASDLHFGPHLHADAAEAFQRMVTQVSPELLVLSGDFTHRANRRQFTQAKDYIARLTAVRVLATPGNHDVPLYSFWRRIFSPYKEYRGAMGERGDSVVLADDFAAAILDTTSPYLRITEGRLSRRQVAFIRTAFRTSTADLRLVVAHHPIAKPDDWKYGRTVDRNRGALTAMVDERVELVLGGHLHRSFSLEAAPGLWVIHSGTTTSTRGRSEERGMQTFNRIRVLPDAFDLEVLSFNGRTKEFETLRRATLPRLTRTPSSSEPVGMVEKAASGI
jgi:3',5'-cyclic AMP phosphodiesterase CpdA